MNDCANADIRDRLPDLIHGTLSPREAAVIVAHIAQCHDCQQEMAVLRGVRAVLLTATPAIDIASVVSALPAPQTPTRWSGSATTWRVAAAVAVLLAAGAAAAIISRSASPDLPPAFAGAVAAASQDGPDGAPVQITVADVNGTPAPVASAVTSSPSTTASGAELTVATSLGGISESQMASLIDQINSIEAIPLPEPVRRSVVPVLLPDSIDVKDLGGSR